MGFDPVSYLMGQKSGGGAAGKIKMKLLALPNDKTSAQLSIDHGIDTSVSKIVFCGTPPSCNADSPLTDCITGYDAQTAYIVKPHAEFGGVSLIFYILLFYIDIKDM